MFPVSVEDKQVGNKCHHRMAESATDCCVSSTLRRYPSSEALEIHS